MVRRSTRGSTRSGKTRRGTTHAVSAVTNEYAPGHKAAREPHARVQEGRENGSRSTARTARRERREEHLGRGVNTWQAATARFAEEARGTKPAGSGVGRRNTCTA